MPGGENKSLVGAKGDQEDMSPWEVTNLGRPGPSHHVWGKASLYFLHFERPDGLHGHLCYPHFKKVDLHF